MSKLRPGEAKKLAQCDTALFDSHVAISVMSSNVWLPGITHPRSFVLWLTFIKKV